LAELFNIDFYCVASTRHIVREKLVGTMDLNAMKKKENPSSMMMLTDRESLS
jgi:hypothetical protein